MSDDAVKAKTGKTWKQWFAILDRAGAKKMSHQEIVKFLNSEHEVGPWWQQMVTVTYEQQSGLRKAHQRPDGYQISVSRTLNAPLRSVYQAFANEKPRRRLAGREWPRHPNGHAEQNNACDMERRARLLSRSPLLRRHSERAT